MAVVVVAKEVEAAARKKKISNLCSKSCGWFKPNKTSGPAPDHWSKCSAHSTFGNNQTKKAMKQTILPTLIGLGLFSSAYADPEKAAKPAENAKVEALKNHAERSDDLADKQDSLSADVQELIDEQTNAKVIELLTAVEMLMAETTERLEDQETGGETIAIETEIVEKIYEAAKQKAKGSP